MLHTRERYEAMKNTMRNNSKPVSEESQVEVKEQQQSPLTMDQIDVRLKRVEKMLFNQGT